MKVVVLVGLIGEDLSVPLMGAMGAMAPLFFKILLYTHVHCALKDRKKMEGGRKEGRKVYEQWNHMYVYCDLSS